MSELKRGGARKINSDEPRRLPRTGAWLLYLLPLPMLLGSLIALFKEGKASVALGAGLAFAIIMLAATLVRKGSEIESQALRRKIVRRASTVPYKLLGFGILGAGVFIGALLGSGETFLMSLVLGAVAALGGLLVYGRDPARSAPDAPAVGVTSEEVLEILNEADNKIQAIEAARGRIHNVELKDRLRNIVAGVREIMGIVEEDPRDLRRARKFLRTYLDGAQRVTEGYADSHKYGENAELEDNFRNVLTTIETVIGEQKQKLLENNLTELDVQIEVLQLQLEKEGV
jgi:5-bromo-4-chloroindolyl phosphate hydrolysis protein